MMSPRTTHGKPRRPLDGGESTTPLDALVRHARRIDAFEAELAEILDIPLKRHCRVANVSAQRVVLDTDTPVWAQRLRFMLPVIERQFARPVLLRVRPPSPLVPERPPAGHRPSRIGADTLEALAESLESDPPTAPDSEERAQDRRLGQALRRLAERIRPD